MVSNQIKRTTFGHKIQPLGIRHEGGGQEAETMLALLRGAPAPFSLMRHCTTDRQSVIGASALSGDREGSSPLNEHNEIRALCGRLPVKTDRMEKESLLSFIYFIEGHFGSHS